MPSPEKGCGGHEGANPLSYFVQYLFYKQWEALRRYANECGIRIIGDMPIYIAADSADAWTSRDMLDKHRLHGGMPAPTISAPPARALGQSVYDWEALKNTGFEWWVRRVAHQIATFRLPADRSFPAV